MRHPLVYWPKSEEAVEVSGPASGPEWGGRDLRVMTWNVQYAAGRGYVFFYDTIPWGGPDERPSPFAVASTLEGIATVIEREAPDVVLLQEIDVGADRTDRVDQAQVLRRRLPDWPWSATAWYWRSAFVPHARVRGAVGLQLMVLSKLRITRARRVPLPLIPGSWLRQAFGFKRAILLAELASGAEPLTVGSTHFDAFAQGTGTMQRQVETTAAACRSLDSGSWALGGDFNLVASSAERAALDPSQKASYAETSELQVLQEWPSVPSVSDLSGPERARWLTYHPNEPVSSGPDRAIDYIFHSQGLVRRSAHVVNDAFTAGLSDHLPIVAELGRPGEPEAPLSPERAERPVRAGKPGARARGKRTA